MKEAHNKSLHWIFTPLRSVKTSEFRRYVQIKNDESCYTEIKMIIAELNGKIPSQLDNMEDILTSNVFSFFKYSERSYLQAYLVNFGLEISFEDAQNAIFKFWPKYSDGTEPDLIVICGKYYILFEAKLFSDFSHETKMSKSQIAREIEQGQLAAEEFGKTFVFVAITAEYYMKNSQYSIFEKKDFIFKWTNWQTVSALLYSYLNEVKTVNNKEFIADLYNLLVKKRLRSFRSLANIKSNVSLETSSYIFYNADTSDFKGEFSGYKKKLSMYDKIEPFKSLYKRKFFNNFNLCTLSESDTIFYNG